MKGKGCNGSFSKCGGTSDPTNGAKPTKGGVVSGGEKKNVSPPNANRYASFNGVGGKSTKAR